MHQFFLGLNFHNPCWVAFLGELRFLMMGCGFPDRVWNVGFDPNLKRFGDLGRNFGRVGRRKTI